LSLGNRANKVLSGELEYCLNDAFHQAREAHHQHLTVEHLLLAILDTPKVGEVLRACGADPPKLRQELTDHVEKSTPRREVEREVQPTIGFQRVLQRAVFHVQSSSQKEVGVSNVLVAIFSEKQSHAVFLLNRQHVNRLRVVNYISHGLSKIAAEKADDDNDENSVESENDSSPPEPGKNNLGWHLERSEKLLATLSDADIEALWQRSEHDPKSLSVDEMGVLFLVLRARVRATEARLKNDSGTGDNGDSP
jgi:ATP-dependent Clp protease ATP-binding subunit ClpA